MIGHHALPCQIIMQPNILVILCDQMRPFELGCYGHPVVRTPNIDALAADGVRFEHGISNNPVCVPARSILLSGQYSRTCTGSLWNHAPWWPPTQKKNRLKDPTLPECLRDAGYFTQLIGKWHIDPDPRMVGFKDSFQAVRIGSGGSFSENGAEPVQAPMFSEDTQVHRLEAFLAEERNEPFFCYYNIYWPHMPLANMPLKYQRMYSRDDVQVRENVPDHSIPERWYHVYMWEHVHQQGLPQPITDSKPEDFEIRDLMALYYGAITWVDDLVGEVMQRLKAAGVADDTIVVFTSDHGENMGSHSVWNKDRFWEESIRIPFIAKGPGIQQGLHNTREQAQLIDVMPTLLDLAGTPVPDHVQGSSLAPVLRGECEDLGRPAAFVETGMYECVARTVDTKYACRIPREGPPIRPWLLSPDDDTEHFLFDLTTDPCERNNLAYDGEHQQDRESLDTLVRDWDEHTPWLAVEPS